MARGEWIKLGCVFLSVSLIAVGSQAMLVHLGEPRAVWFCCTMLGAC